MPDPESNCSHTGKPARGSRWRNLRRWYDTREAGEPFDAQRAERVDWLRAAPFILLHLGCIAALWTGVSATAGRASPLAGFSRPGV